MRCCFGVAARLPFFLLGYQFTNWAPFRKVLTPYNLYAQLQYAQWIAKDIADNTKLNTAIKANTASFILFRSETH